MAPAVASDGDNTKPIPTEPRFVRSAGHLIDILGECLADRTALDGLDFDPNPRRLLSSWRNRNQVGWGRNSAGQIAGL